MSRYLVFLLVVLGLVAIVCPSVFGLAREYDLNRPVSQSDWPAGLGDLLNARKPVHAYYVNFQDMFFYSGEASAFNAFVERYGRLQGIPHTLVLHCDKAETRDKFHGEKMDSYDWHVLVDKISQQEYLVTVHLFLGGSVKLSEIKVPANVKVESGGEIEKFIKEHNASLSSPPAEGAASWFGVYLLADESVGAVDALKWKLEDVPLQDVALFTMNDITRYLRSSHSSHYGMQMTDDALRRLPPVYEDGPPLKRLPKGVPFVFVAGGKRIYLGAFCSVKPPAAFKNPVIYIVHAPVRSSNILWIDPGEMPPKDDPYHSPLIKAAFEKAGKLDIQEEIPCP